MIEIPNAEVFRTLGDRRSIRYFDPDRKAEDWKIEAMLQAARFASCQGNINATEAVVVQKETSELWDEIEECVSGFNVQIINQCSHVIFWLTNLNAWYGRANDGISSLALAGASTHYHGWNYEFTMTQTVPRLMSFPTERTDILLRFESGQAVANAIVAGVALGLGNCLLAFGRKPGGVEKAFELPPHLRFTWAHAVGYPLEEPKAGGQRPRLKFEKLFHRDRYGTPLPSSGEVADALRDAGLIQDQAPLPGRFDEIDRLAERFGRDPGVVSWPAREIERLISDEDWDFGPAIRARAAELLERGGLPDYPKEMRATFARLMSEHGIDTAKYLS